MRPQYSLADLVPHREPMLLIDEIVDVDLSSRRLVAAVVVKPEWSENCVAVEYMAQSAAALAGYFDKIERADCKPRPGMLLGARRLELFVERFSVGERYLIEVAEEYSDGQAASFDCRILAGDGKVVATARINAFRPDDFVGFMKNFAQGGELA